MLRKIARMIATSGVVQDQRSSRLSQLSWSRLRNNSSQARDLPEAIARMEKLVDSPSHLRGIREDGRLLRNGIAMCTGVVCENDVCIYSHDYTRDAGSISQQAASDIEELYGIANSRGIPIIGICSSAGVYIQKEHGGLTGAQKILKSIIGSTGKVFRMAVLLGPCAGICSLSAVLSDIVVASSNSSLFLVGPRVANCAAVEHTSLNELGGADIHAKITGHAHLIGRDDAQTLALARQIISYFGQKKSSWRKPGSFPGLPSRPSSRSEMISIVKAVFDEGSFLEIHELYGNSIISGLARMKGVTVGVIASASAHSNSLATQDIRKMSSLVKLIRSSNSPLVIFVDSPPLAPNKVDVACGIMGDVANLIVDIDAMKAKRIVIIVGDAFNVPFLMLASKEIGQKAVYAWPTACVGVMSEVHASKILHKGISDLDTTLSPTEALEEKLIDSIISPKSTRDVIIKTLMV